jgi:hypothetical protein
MRLTERHSHDSGDARSPCARPLFRRMTAQAPSARYEIRLRGVLSDCLLAAFPDLHVETRGAATVLTGGLPDQSALFGVLAQVEALGLELLGVHRLDARAE